MTKTPSAAARIVLVPMIGIHLDNDIAETINRNLSTLAEVISKILDQGVVETVFITDEQELEKIYPRNKCWISVLLFATVDKNIVSIIEHALDHAPLLFADILGVSPEQFDTPYVAA